MDKVIVTGLLVIAAVTAALVVVMTVIPSLGSTGQSVVQSQQEAAGRIMTSIEIIAVSAKTNRIDAWVKNVGVATVSAVSKSDVFLVTPGTRYDAVKYNPAGGDNTWVEDPLGASWNRGDTLHLVIDPAGTLPAGTHMLRIGTPNGVAAEYTFSWQ